MLATFYAAQAVATYLNGGAETLRAGFEINVRRPAYRGLFQIERVEAFGKPVIDRSKKFAGLIPLTLIAPEPGLCSSFSSLLRFPRFT